MGDLIELKFKQRQSEEYRNDLWQAYCEAARKAQSSRDIQDGIAAGRAWAAWLASFRVAQ